MPIVVGRCSSTPVNASRPPAEAPIPTIGKEASPDKYSSLVSIMVLVTSLFLRSPPSVTIDHEAKSARKDHDEKENRYKLEHISLLYCSILDMTHTVILLVPPAWVAYESDAPLRPILSHVDPHSAL